MYDSQYNQLNCNVIIEEESLYNSVNEYVEDGLYATKSGDLYERISS